MTNILFHEVKDHIVKKILHNVKMKWSFYEKVTVMWKCLVNGDVLNTLWNKIKLHNLNLIQRLYYNLIKTDTFEIKSHGLLHENFLWTDLFPELVSTQYIIFIYNEH